MRIAIISPYSQGPVRGNVITVQRIAEALTERGQSTHIFPRDVQGGTTVEDGLTSFAPDVILAFHAFYCGDFACNEARRMGIPCVVIITGSDISEPHFRDHPRTIFAMDQADAVVCFDDHLAKIVLEFFPKSLKRLAVIPQGVTCLLESGPIDDRIPEDAYVILLPAALRPVKNIEEPLKALSRLTDRYPLLRFIIAGGVVDRNYADVICELLKDAPFAIWLGEVPHEQMGPLYARSDVVLNCSLYEGMPNSLLEAMVLGRPVLAADIPGNRSLVRDNQTGWLYSGPAGLTDAVERLMNDPGQCLKVGRQARDLILSDFSPQVEAARYIELCTSLRALPRLENQERCCA